MVIMHYLERFHELLAKAVTSDQEIKVDERRIIQEIQNRCDISYQSAKNILEGKGFSAKILKRLVKNFHLQEDSHTDSKVTAFSFSQSHPVNGSF